MIHTLTHPLPAAGFALADPASRPHPKASRIIALSSAIALNLLLFGSLSLPTSLPPGAFKPIIDDTPTLRLIPRTPEVVPVQPVRQPVAAPTPIRHTAIARPRSHAEPTAITAPATPMSEPAVPVTASDDTTETTEVSIAPSAEPVQLAYRQAPAPTYPRSALRMGFGGTVLLRVLVDVDGHPLQVTIERSSGHRDLDEAARRQILDRWQFQPAVRDGHAVQAYGLIPIVFSPQR